MSTTQETLTVPTPEDVAEALTLDRFESWVRNKADLADLGVAGEIMECPLATYLRQVFLRKFGVSYTEVMWWGEDAGEWCDTCRMYHKNPTEQRTWLGELESVPTLVDHLFGPKNVVGKRGLLEVIDRIKRGDIILHDVLEDDNDDSDAC